MRSDDDLTIPKNLDFSGGVRGKYAGRFAEESIAVVLEPDVAAVFKNAQEVNTALRDLIRLRSSED